MHCIEPSKQVVGFYTLSSYSFNRDFLERPQQKKIPPQYVVPAILLGRLAVSSAYKNRKIGAQLLIDALRRSLELSNSLGAYAVAVDAKDEEAASFYKHYKFLSFEDDRLRLYLPMKTIRDLIPPQCLQGS